MTRRRREQRARLDWPEIHRRLDAAGRALDEHATRTPARVRALLEERARLLARRPDAPPSADALDVVTFRLAGESYAVETEYVVEVFRLASLTLLPGAEPPLFALTARRGTLLTLLDLRRALGLSPAALNDLTTVIAVGRDTRAFGLLVDAVDGVTTLRADELHPAPTDDGYARPHLRGITRDAVTILDGSALLRLLK